MPCYCFTEKCKGFIGKKNKFDQHSGEIERYDANIEETTTEEQQVDQNSDEIERDDANIEETPTEANVDLAVEQNEHTVTRAPKRGRPLKKNAHKRLNIDLNEMKGRRSKNSLKVLKLRLSRVDQQAIYEEDSDSN